MFKKATVIVLIISIFFTPSYAGWVDDWITQHTETGPTTVRGQKRGYFTAGSLSARWQTSNEHLFSITLPKINVGCGGIDLFGGGFAFLNPEYLVQQLQQILAGAAAAAFDMALKVLCEQCSETIKSLQQMISKLNSMQLDSCNMGKNLAVELLGPLDKEKFSKELSEADAYWAQKANEFAFWKDWENSTRSNGGTPAKNDALKKTLEQCPADIKDLIGIGTGSSDSLLANIAAKHGLPYSYVYLIRGVVGDVKVGQAQNGDFTVFPDTFCSENTLRVEDFLTGKVYQKYNGVCTLIPDTNANLLNYTQTKVKSIYDKIRNKQNLTQDDFNLIKNSPPPLLMAMKAAVATGADDTAISQLAEVLARETAYAMLMDLYAKIQFLIAKGEEALHKTGNDKMNCNTALIKSAIEGAKPLAERARDYAGRIQADNARAYEGMTSVLKISERYEKWYNIYKQEIVGRFCVVGGLL